MLILRAEGLEVLWTVLLTFVCTGLLWFSFFLYEYKKLKTNLTRRQKKRLDEAKREVDRAEEILSALHMGVAYYDASGRLKSLNERAKELFDLWPETYQGFLDHYGQANDLRSEMVMGKARASVDFPEGKTCMRITVQALESQKAHVVMVQDISQQVREARQQKEFVSNVSHELRTPLTTIKGYSESLIDWGIQEKKKDQVIKDVGRIYEDSIRMEKLIEDLTLLSRVDESSIGSSMHVRPLDPVLVTRQVTERMQPQAAEAGCRMQCTVVANIPKIYADRSQFERVLTNLISNAIKYGKPKGRVDIYLGFLIDEVYIKVKDDGIGIDRDNQKQIYDRFFRVDNSGSRMLGGTGLGLSIVKEIVDLHLGSLQLESVRFKGSEFTVMLPSAEKVLETALSELHLRGACMGPITEAAQEDLAQLAESMGLVANWKSLKSSDYQALLTQLKKAHQVLQKRQRKD